MSMRLNDGPCQTCRDFQSASPIVVGLPSPIREADTIVRGGERFVECPKCGKLYAVKRDADTTEYRLVSSASVNRQYQWIVDAEDGTRQRAKGTMTEEEAHRKHANPEKIIHRPIR